MYYGQDLKFKKAKQDYDNEATVMGDKVKGMKGNEDLGQNIKVGKHKIHFGENNQSLLSRYSKDFKLDTDTDTFVDHYKYWNDQMKAGNYTNGEVTPKNPEMTPNKHGF